MEVFKNLRAIVAAPHDPAAQDDLIKDAKKTVQEICSDHIAAADEFIRDAQLSAALKEETERDCQLLIEYLEAARRFNLEINSRAKDRVVSFGEKLSCRFMTYLLKDRVSYLLLAVGFLASFGTNCEVKRGLMPSMSIWRMCCIMTVQEV